MKQNMLAHGLILSFLTVSSLAGESLVPRNLLRVGDGTYYSPYAIVVDKDKRLTSIWKNADGQLTKVKEYANDLGKALGDKLVEGDNKTPEGIYVFQEVLQKGQIPYEKYGVRALTTNYPNLFDKREGKTGHGIWLHAIPDTESLHRGSEGCVVVRNQDILEISEWVKLEDTFFVVEDKAEYVDSKQLSEKRVEIEEFLRSWRRAWVDKDLINYMNAYADSFYSAKKNKEQWQQHKARLNEVYKKIFVEFSDPVFVEVDGQIKVRMLQHYRSDTMDDYGEKTLYIEREAETLKIVAETFKKVDRDIAKTAIAQGSILRDTKITDISGELSASSQQD